MPDLVAAWECSNCDSGGRDPRPVTCFACGNTDVTITAIIAADASIPPPYRG